MRSLFDIAKALGRARSHGDYYTARCPCHDDAVASLSLTEKDGTLLVKCHAGCDQAGLVVALKDRDLWPRGPLNKNWSEPPPPRKPPVKKSVTKLSVPAWKRPVEKVYKYVDANGTLIFESVKFSDGLNPRFLQRRPNLIRPSVSVYNLKGVTPILYNLPEIISSKEPIYICEGEKDVDALRTIGLVSTTNPMGAGKWRDDYNQYFIGKTVCVIADNDDPGRKHAAHLKKILQPITKQFFEVSFKDKKKGYDISDWIVDGGTSDELRKMIHAKTAVSSGALGEPTYIEWVHCRATGGPKTTKENMRLLLDKYGITARYNIIKKRLEVNIPGLSIAEDGQEFSSMMHIVSLCEKHGFKLSRIEDFVLDYAYSRSYNPVAEWITSKPWDKKTERFDPLVNSLGAEHIEIARSLLWRWLLSCVAAVFERDGISAQGALILQGNQYIGKTSWFRALVGKNIEFVKLEGAINPSNKDSAKIALSHWLVELAEIASTFRKADIDALKAFLTSQRDDIRLPYRRDYSSFSRRTVFMGSVNERQFLVDDTGNRRYWVIGCSNKLNARHGIDMQQLWAQIYWSYKKGEQWILTRYEMDALNKANEDFSSRGPYYELIMEKFGNAPAGCLTKFMQAAQVATSIGYTNQSHGINISVGRAVRKIFGPPRKSAGKKGWDMPDFIRNRP